VLVRGVRDLGLLEWLARIKIGMNLKLKLTKVIHPRIDNSIK
jgi:hypothetical protein